MSDIEETGAPPDTGSTESAQGQAPGTESQPGTDRFSDPELKKHIEDQVSQRLRHIPNDYRSPESFQKLMQSHKQFEGLQRDPNYIAYLAARQGGGQNQQQQQAKRLRDTLIENLSTKYGKFDDNRSAYLGDFADHIEKYITDSIIPNVLKQHVAPMYDLYYGDKVNAEFEQAKKLPNFSNHESKVKELVARTEGRITWDEAYRIVAFDEAKKAAAAADVAAEDENDKRRAVTEKPTGRGSKDLKHSKPSSKAEAKRLRDSILRAQGIDV